MIGVLVTTQREKAITKGISINGIGFSKREVKEPLELGIFVNNQEYCKVQSSYGESSYNLQCNFNDVSIVESFYYARNQIQAAKDLVNNISDAMSGQGFNAFSEYVFPTITYADGNPCGNLQIGSEVGEDGKNISLSVGNILGLNIRYYNIGTDNNANATTGNYSYIYGEDNVVKAALCEQYGKVIIYANEEIWFRVACLLAINIHVNLMKESSHGNTYILDKNIKKYANKDFVNIIINSTSPENLPENMTLVKEAIKKCRKKSTSLPLAIFMILFSIVFMTVGFKTYIADQASRKTCTETTEAVIVDIERIEHTDSDGTSITYAPVYEYTVNNKTYKEKSYVSYGKADKYTVGDKVSIIYNPSNPETYYVKGEKTSLLFCIVFVAFGGVFFIFGVIFLLRKIR